jgi:hypothetical protein
MPDACSPDQYLENEKPATVWGCRLMNEFNDDEDVLVAHLHIGHLEPGDVPILNELCQRIANDECALTFMKSCEGFVFELASVPSDEEFDMSISCFFNLGLSTALRTKLRQLHLQGCGRVKFDRLGAIIP